MYPRYNMYQNRRNMHYGNQINDTRLGGGFVVPFLLGGLTGGAIVGSRPNGYNRPNYYYPTYPYPYYNSNYYYPPYSNFYF